MCFACICTSIAGGYVGGLIGIKTPDYKGAALLSTSLTSSLVTITTLALKSFFNFTFCQGNLLIMKNVALLVGANLIIAIVYNIGINSLLGRFVYPPAPLKACCQSTVAVT